MGGHSPGIIFYLFFISSTLITVVIEKVSGPHDIDRYYPGTCKFICMTEFSYSSSIIGYLVTTMHCYLPTDKEV